MVLDSSSFDKRLIVRNSLFNFSGYLIPLCVAVVATPLLIRGLGIERFGILSLVWVVIGYFGFFDLGVGRSVTKYASEYMANGNFVDLNRVFWTGLGLLMLLGIFGGVVILFSANTIVNTLLKLPPYLERETVISFNLLAISLPFALGIAATHGILEARQQFGILNALKIPMNISSLVLPVMMLLFSNSLEYIVIALVCSRVAWFFVHLRYCIISANGALTPLWPDRLMALKLIKFGGWLTISNIVGPVMTYLDRFIIGGIIGVGAIAYYTTPYDFVARLWIIPASIMSVTFPLMSASAPKHEKRLIDLYRGSVKSIIVIAGPILLFLIIITQPFLLLWLGQDFADKSAMIMQIFVFGAFLNFVAQVPFAALHAMGRPDLTAKIHLVELPLYLAFMIILIGKFGILGVALAWLLRVAVDIIILTYYSNRILPLGRTYLNKTMGPAVVVLATFILSIYLSSYAFTFSVKIGVQSIVYISFLGITWGSFISKEDRKFIKDIMRKFKRKNAVV